MLRLFLILSIATSAAFAKPTWHSVGLDAAIACKLLEPTVAPTSAQSPLQVIIYLENLAAPRIGTDSDEAIIADFRATGYLVAVLDYARHPQSRWPHLTPDLVALRAQIHQKTFLAGRTIDAAHIFIVPSGCRLKRDVVFYRAADRTLAMDIIYPSRPAHAVGTVLEFSCDNADRMGNFSLNFCTDTILAGAAIQGFVVAMADHPVAAPYQGIDAMPDCAWKIKAAVRTLRAEVAALGGNGRIVPVGFSRGSGMALMLATTVGRSEFEGHGEHLDGDSSVQGAVVMSGRFTYLNLLPTDKIIPRYEKLWGPRTQHEDVWRAHGALDYLNAPAAVPLFLTINATESPDALHQMEVLRHRLTALDSPFVYQPESEPRGHRMPLAPTVLDPLFRYLHDQLQVAPVPSTASSPLP